MRLRAIDSHTGGEPTRVLPEGEIALEGATMADRREDLRVRFAGLRRAIVGEPRAAEATVGAVLTPPVTPGATVGVVFFDRGGPLGMCGHGTIGVVETLRYLGRIAPGPVVLDTPVGVVQAELLPTGEVRFENVESRRTAVDVSVDVDNLGRLTGDVAYGGNWFYFVKSTRFEVSPETRDRLVGVCHDVMGALDRGGIRGDGGERIDHVVLEADQAPEGTDSCHFILCPSGTYDRSPCGTGTSAKLACLIATGTIAPGDEFRQTSPTGSVFRGSAVSTPNGVRPTIVGRAYVTAETTLVLADEDPLREGLL